MATAASENGTRQIVELRYEDYPDNLHLWFLLVEETTAGYEGPESNPGGTGQEGLGSGQDTAQLAVYVRLMESWPGEGLPGRYAYPEEGTAA
ncbi:MAG: hypothetical protein JWR71_3359 [Pseudarthrobacter sp.]|nr:hypothetical protein [Pseudarthrobacter sp.]